MAYREWGLAFELQELHKRGICPDAPEGVRHLGRAQAPRFAKVALRQRNRLFPEATKVPGGASPLSMLWATLRAQCSRLRSAIANQKHCAVLSCKAALVGTCCSRNPAVVKAWLECRCPADVNAARCAILRAVKASAGLPDLDACLAILDRLLQRELSRDHLGSTRSWKTWVAKSLPDGASAAHRWTNAPNAPQLSVVAPGTVDAEGTLEYHASSWETIWASKDSDQVREAQVAIQQLRERALHDPGHGRLIDTIVPSRLRSIAKRFKKRTGIGVDDEAFTELAGASDEALESLCALLRECVDGLAVPIQTLLTLMSLLAKKAGGSRAIALVSTILRLLLAFGKEEIRAWDLEVGLPGDTGLPGKALEVEASRRHLLVGLAKARGWKVILLMGRREVLRQHVRQGYH